MDFVRIWLLPPLVGGLIGWFTNWLAIKMLFRPLREYRFLGMRLPFTPGILPRERSRLARSIGEVVSKELLTPEVLKARMAAPEVEVALEAAIRARLEEASGLDAGNFLAAAAKASAGPVSELLSSSWRNLVSSPPFAEALRASLGGALSALHRVPLSAVLPPEGARELASKALSPAGAERLKVRLVGALASLYEERDASAAPGPAGGLPVRARGSVTLAELVPPEALEPLVRALAEGLYRAAVPGVEDLLRSPALRRGMEREANRILHNAIERLGLLQRLFVGVAGYERRLEETMPETVRDLVFSVSNLLREPSMPSRAAEAALDAFREAAAAPLARAGAALVSREAALAAAGAFVDALRDHGPELAARAAALAASGGASTLGGLMDALGLEREDVAQRAARAAAGFLAGEASGAGGGSLGEAAGRFSAVLAEGLRGTSLGALAGLDAARRESLSSWLAGRALGLVAAEADRMLEGFDVAGMVVRRLEELDMRDIERIILGVVDRELFWITALGGLLGAGIGLAQAFLTLIGR